LAEEGSLSSEAKDAAGSCRNTTGPMKYFQKIPKLKNIESTI
jgi:hypothetical protein